MEFAVSLQAEIDGCVLLIPMNDADMQETLADLCAVYLVPLGAVLTSIPLYVKKDGIGYS